MIHDNLVTFDKETNLHPDLHQPLRFVHKYWRGKHQPPNLTLYHYANGQGLCGIVSTGKIWATNIAFLNDSSELEYGADLVTSVLSGLAERCVKNIGRDIIAEAANTCNIFGGVFHPHVACFCESKDLLSQWRGYGNSNDGYAIGIKSSALCGFGMQCQPKYRLRRVIYNRDLQQRMITRMAGVIGERVNRLAAKVHPREKDKLFAQGHDALITLLADLICTFKDGAFTAEGEWRLVCVHNYFQDRDELLFRSRSGMLTPYHELKLWNVEDGKVQGQTSIEEIILGPGIHRKLGALALELLLAKHGHHNVHIEPSSVPFRSG